MSPGAEPRHDPAGGSTAGASERFAPLLPLVLATMASQGLLVVLAPTIVEVGRSLDASVGAVGQARSIAAAAAIAVSAAVPGLLARIGLRGILRAGIGLAIAGSALVAAAPSLAVYLLAHVPAGAGLGLLLSAGFTGVATFAAADRPWAMGYVAAANALAWIVANPVIGVLTDTVSWRAGQLVPAALALAALALASRARPLTESPPPRGALRALAADPGGRRWAAAELLAYCAWAGALLTFIGAFFIERHGASASLTGLLLAGGAAAFVLASVRSGALTARFARKQLARYAALAMTVLVAVLFAAPLELVPAFAIFCLVGALAGVRTPASAGLGMAQLADRPEVMMAARTGTTQLGYLVGAVTAGTVLAIAGWEVLGLTFAAVLALSALAFARVPDPEARRG